MAEDKNKEVKTPTYPDMSGFKDITRQIIEANGDQGKITSLLVQLEDHYNNLFAEHSTMQTEYTKVTEENGKLKEYNLELYMNRGSGVAAREGTGTGGTQAEKSAEEIRAETITPEDLFKEEK